MWKSLKSFLVGHLISLLNFLGSILSGLLELLWKALGPAFEMLFSLLGTLWGRFLATLTLLVGLALSPLVEFVKSAIVDFASTLGAPPDVVASLFPNNFQALCYVAVNFCSLDVMISCVVSFLLIKGICFTILVGTWTARKAASILRGAGV